METIQSSFTPISERCDIATGTKRELEEKEEVVGKPKGDQQASFLPESTLTAMVLHRQGKSPLEAIFGPNGPYEAVEPLLSRLDVSDVKALRQVSPLLGANPILESVEKDPSFRNLLLGRCWAIRGAPGAPSQAPGRVGNRRKLLIDIRLGRPCLEALRDGPLTICEVHDSSDKVFPLCELHFTGGSGMVDWPFQDELNAVGSREIDVVLGICIGCENNLMTNGVKDAAWCKCERRMVSLAKASRCFSCREYSCLKLSRLSRGKSCEDCMMSREDYRIWWQGEEYDDFMNRVYPDRDRTCENEHTLRLKERNRSCRMCHQPLTERRVEMLKESFEAGDPYRKNSWKVYGSFCMFLWCPICNELLCTPWLGLSERKLGVEPSEWARCPRERTPDSDGSCSWGPPETWGWDTDSGAQSSENSASSTSNEAHILNSWIDQHS